MIHLRITNIARRASSNVQTRRYVYHQDKPREVQVFHGAEWEEVEFQLEQELEPPVGIANVEGSAFLLGDTCRILINSPELFDKFKVGDIIHFVPHVEVVQTTGTEIPQEPPVPTEEPIIIPSLV